MNRTYFALLSSVLVVLATASGVSCTPGPAPVSQSVADPSSPSAPEGPPVALADTLPVLTAPAPADAQAHHGHPHDAPAASAAPSQGVTYVCPMDPDVTSKAPGVCPKCNMKLVPKK